jgi:hypothetical protein
MSSITYDNIVYINNDLVVDTNTLYVDSSNNRVGINTVPSYEFDVSGNVKLTSIIDRLGLTGNNGQVLSSTGIEVEWKDVSGSGGSGTNYWDLSGSNLYNNSGTNVGINTNNPVYEVDISGETRIQTTNIRIGREAGDTLQGSFAIAIGLFAGRFVQNINGIGIGNQAGSTQQGSGAIAFGIFNYIRHTGDTAYLETYGLPVLAGIARFWAQRFNWSEAKQAYVMLGVTGPNEYENNVNNNWYTNYIARWCIDYCLEVNAAVQNDLPEKLTKKEID